ncbi:forkhead-associated domain-containing protein 1 isoform X2 [Varanus komodoensis]|uniref:forkhead-associated domain-containing protein 1 isoform X2 n=1 Tax=Varanus komodoensis TaxID=61221 RepID=UPI001CF78BEB|nr:forkhead-associated domain-containing protein 1 isoform X2 [Varanus komodoensis]
MKAFLRSSEGILALRPKRTTIGRHEDSDIILKSSGVEGHHAAIELSDSENNFILRDFNSTHGTFVNDCHIQNAAVKVSPGDILRFGASGPSFELLLENAPQVSCPPVGRHPAWSGPLQIVTEAKPPPAPAAAQFPSLQSRRSPPINRSWSFAASGTSPHPPLGRRPVNAWGRAVPSPSFSPDAFSRPPAIVSGNGVTANAHQGDALLKERDELILRKGNEISRLSSFENECSHKDTVIANLQSEIAAMTEKINVVLAKKDAEFCTKLAGLEQEVGAKTEEIKALREQINHLQQNTSEVLYHSLSERDLQIANWKQENEKLKKSYSLTAGLVTSLQKDITSKDQKIQQLKMDAEKFRRESREKDTQLAHVSAQHIGELELRVKRSEEEIRKYRAEQEALSSRLADKTKAEGDLKKEYEKRSQQLQEMGRRERLMKSDMELAAAQAQRFRNKVVESLSPQLLEQSATDQQIVDKIKQIQASNKEYIQRETLLREEIRAKDSEMEDVSGSIELLKKSLDGFQDFLKTSYCSSSLREEMCHLQALCLSPPASGVQASVCEVLCSLLRWVDAVERLLQDVGIDASDSEKGMTCYMQRLLDQHCDTVGKLQTLQSELRITTESQHSLLQEKLQDLRLTLEKEFQDRERELTEGEKEHRKILEEMAALQEAKLKEAIAEEKKKVQDLETQIGQLAEVIEQKTKSEEVLNMKLRETLESLELAKKRKAVTDEKLAFWEQRLKSVESGSEILRQKHQEEISEYKEQVRQHSKTIVELESKFLEAAQRMEKVKEENATLQKQVEEMRKEPSSPLPSSPQEAPREDRPHVLLKEELAAAKHEILSNQTIISELKKELSEARARMSDVIGELNDKQKMELEQKRSLVHSQAHELNHLREKLFEMSKLVDQEEADLKAAGEELRRSSKKLKELRMELKEKAEEAVKEMQHRSVQTSVSLPEEDDPGFRKVSTLDLADLGARCKGCRHEETIQRQKDALAELRQRVKMLEKTRPLDFEERSAVPRIVLRKGPAEKREQKTEKEQVAALMVAMDASKLQSDVPSIDPNVVIERTARLEMGDALDLSESTYFNLIQDLANLMNVKELGGMQTVKHLPQDEREKVKMLRQKDLELLFDKITKLKSRLDRKESLLKEYERDIGQFRANKQTLQACQQEMAKLSDKIYREAEEKAFLKEALERTKLQLTQEKRLNRAFKQQKNHLEEKRSEISSCHPCTLKFKDKKAATLKKPLSQTQTTVERPGEACKKQAPCNTSAWSIPMRSTTVAHKTGYLL